MQIEVIEMRASNKFVLLIALLLAPAFAATAQTGGSYDLSHNVIAGGGGSINVGGTFTLDGTVGQPQAGTLSFGGIFNLRGGFWAFAANGPTASGVYLSGQVTTPEGEGISGVKVILIDTFTNLTRTTTTTGKGSFLFEDLSVTHFYIVRVRSKQYIFAPESYTFEVTGNLEGMNFTGELQQPPQSKEPK
jgi:hypothetical protein